MVRLLNTGAYRVALVVAPAGSGKSRLLSHLAARFPGSVAWCGVPDTVPRSEDALVGWIWESLGPALEGESRSRPRRVGELVGLASGPGAEMLVVLDDIHLVDGLASEAALSELVLRCPPRLRLVMASRANLNLDLSRLRVSGQLVEIGQDDLRFRTWEVEELFRDVYGEPLLPEDVAALAQRTAGWAAYLQLFFLATARKPLAERRRVLNTLSARNRLVSEYLGRHALAELSPELQEFLVGTSPLRRPTASTCDELLGRDAGSQSKLAELERRQLFTERIDDDSYRYHSVLLSYLDSKLVETAGVGGAREAHRLAGTILEREGWLEDALAAFTKAEDWEGVARLAGIHGSPPGVIADAWVEALPPAIVESDPLLLIVRSHRALARGAIAEALQALRDAESVASSQLVAERCRAERDMLAPWVDPERRPTDDWLGVIRQATRSQPRDAQQRASRMGGSQWRVAEGLSALIAGDMLGAARALRVVAHHEEAGPVVAAAAALAAAAAAYLASRPPTGAEIGRIREELDATGVPWLDRIARAALQGASPASATSLDALAEACERDGDRWGSALVGVIAGIRALLAASPDSAWALERAARTFGELGAGSLEATCAAYASMGALAGGAPELAQRLASQARTLSSLHEVPGAAGVAALARWKLSGDERELSRARDCLVPLGTWEWHAALAGAPESPADRDAPAHGHAAPGPGHATGSNGAGAASGNGRANGTAVGPPLEASAALSCLGSYRLSFSGVRVEEEGAKPMERALLHLLSMRPGESLHREDLIEALWPEADPDAGLHRLQVAVSSIRRLLAAAGADSQQVLTRDRESYRLSLPDDADVDVWRIERAAHAAALARTTGDAAAEETALVDMMSAYGGPLLADDGPADWLVERRRGLQALFVEAATRRSLLRLKLGDLETAAAVARAGLAVDRYRDELWKLLIETAERAGNHAEAEQARRSYEGVLAELGV
jgi:DNA-binding SARP family transcriptional activator